jgi:ferrous iron transport protein B
MPVYRVPTVRNVSYKAWFRVREFIWEAWPILILGSLFLAFAMYFDLTNFFNLLVRPFTWVLGLPGEVGVPLIFGILRKELSLIMLRQALGVIDISKALTTVQMVTFAVFVMFYIPCLATLAVLKRELGMRAMLWVCAITIVIATLAALAARGVTTLFY